MVSPMLLPHFDFESPANLEEACGLLSQAPGDSRVLAGGTDLLVKLKRGDLGAKLVVSLAAIEGLDWLVDKGSAGLKLGPLCTMAKLAKSTTLGSPWTALAEGAAAVGGPIIRNRATVGGNIINARPCADTVPPLMALGARLNLESSAGSRSVDLDGFITAPGVTGLLPGEILTGIEIPNPTGGGAGSRYLKVTRRCAMEVTTVGCAASIVLDEARKTIKSARIVLTSVAPVLLRVPSAEAVLIGQQPSESLLLKAAQRARAETQPIDDQRASADYRKQMVQVLTNRALATALQRALEVRP